MLAAILIFLGVMGVVQVHGFFGFGPGRHYRQYMGASVRTGAQTQTQTQAQVQVRTGRSGLLLQSTVRADNKGNKKNVQKVKKVREEKQPLVKPHVTRVSLKDRIGLDELKVGEKRRGRIISIVAYGMFIDIGSKRDGFLHIKEASNSYFVQNLESKFSPGQDVDVWIKLVDAEAEKLQLQLYPYKEKLEGENSRPIIKCGDLAVEGEISGTAVKYSNYGVFMDIGMGEELAFLHRRKMKLTRRQKNFMPWEIIPLGQEIKAYVHTLDVDRSRVGLTTYAPEDWEIMFPDEDEDELDEADVEAAAGSANNFMALERTLALSLEDDEEDIGASVELFTDDAILALQASRRKSSKVLIDDFGDANDNEDGDENEDGSSKQSTKMSEYEDAFDELTIEELFDSLSNGRQYVTMRDLKDWDYLTDVLGTDALSEDQLKAMVAKAGGKRYQMLEGQFELFVEMLADHLGLDDEDDGDLSEYRESAEDTPSTSTSTSTSKQAAPKGRTGTGAGTGAGAAVLMNDFDDLDEEESSNAVGTTTTGVALGSGGLEQEEDGDEDIFGDDDDKSTRTAVSSGLEKENPNALLSTLYGSLVDKSLKGVPLSKLLSWDLVSTMLAEGKIDEEKVASLFKECKGERDAKSTVLQKNQFESFIQKLGAYEEAISGSASGDEDGQGEDLYGHDDDEEMSLQEAFLELTNDAEFMDFKTLVGWSLVSQLEENDFLTTKQLEKFYKQAGAVSREEKGKGKKKGKKAVPTVDFVGFEKFLDLIEPFLKKHYEEMDAEDEEGEEGVGEDKDEDEEISIEDAFYELTEEAEYISFDKLMEWDVVGELVEEGLLSDAQAREIFDQAGAEDVSDDGSGSVSKMLDIEGFERFLDLIQPFAGDDEGDEGEEGEEGEDGE